MTAPEQRTPMDAKTLTQVAQWLIAARQQEAPRFNLIYEYFRNRIVDIYVPKGATEEYRKLVDQSRFNILPLLEESLGNNFFMDGYRPARKKRNAKVWDAAWQPNRMDARQAGMWRSALRYGTSYVTVLPGQLDDKPMPVITPWSPRRMTALYDDPLSDEWARYALEVGTTRPQFSPDGVTMVTRLTIYDDWFRYRFDVPSAMMAIPTSPMSPYALPQGTGLTVDAEQVQVGIHAMGVCPVVRILDSFGDLDDAPEGILYPMLPAQRQLNQSTFGLLITQNYQAFRQRWVSGMAIELDDNGVPKEPWNAAVNRVWQAEEPDTKFGEFGQADLSGYLDSRDKTLAYVSAARHQPPHTLVISDSIANISAEALAALQAEQGMDIATHQTSFGEGAEQLMRLAGLAMDDRATWEDTSAQARWRDTTPRSLAQLADALGKFATMLGVPPEALWEHIPFATDQDLDQWKKLAKESDTFGKLEGLMARDPRAAAAGAGAPAAGGGGSGAGGAAGS